MSSDFNYGDQVFRAMTNATDLSALEEALRGTSFNTSVVSLLKDLDTERLDPEDLRRAIESATSTAPEAVGLITFWFLRREQHNLTREQLVELVDFVEQTTPASTSASLCTRVALWGVLSREGDVTRAQSLFSGDLPDGQEGDLCERYMLSLAHSRLGWGSRILGDFKRAQDELNLAQSIAEACDFREVVAMNSQRLAGLLWASGQHRAALSMHRTKQVRETLRSRSLISLLISSHLSAAKCAIDFKSPAVAKEELAAAKSLIQEHPDCRADYPGYLDLYSGELHILEERYEDGEQLIQKALTHFESMDPPHHPGALDAKIALAHFALYERNYKLATLILQRLLAEAEERQCLDARSRLLALETYLFVTEEPPLRPAFDDLITRLHLINNPAILFRALGNLYTYALEFLDEQDQAFLLMRIRNLKKVLDATAYDDLYSQYVSERYEYAIENRLARFVDRDWEGWAEWEEDEQEPDDDTTSTERDDRS